MKTLMIVDPDGNHIAFAETTDKSGAVTTDTCWGFYDAKQPVAADGQGAVTYFTFPRAEAAVLGTLPVTAHK